MRRQQIPDKFVGFPAGGAVADGDQFDIVGFDHLQQHRAGFGQFVLRWGGEDGAVVQHLAGGIDHRHFDAGAQARVQSDGGARACRRRQQQVFEVGGEHLDGIGLGALAQLAQQVSLEMDIQFDLPGPAHHFAEPFVGRAVGKTEVPVVSHHGLAGAGTGFVAELDVEGEYALIAAAKHGQRPVRGRGFQSFAVLEVVAELLAFLFLAGHHCSGEFAFFPDKIAQLLDQVCVFGKPLHQNVFGTVQGVFAAFNFVLGVEVAGGLGLRVELGVA